MNLLLTLLHKHCVHALEIKLTVIVMIDKTK